MTNASQKQKLLFVHTPKAAGVHLLEYFKHQLDYPVISSEKRDEKGVWVDYTIDEHIQFLNAEKALLRTHTLAYGWHELAYCIPTASKKEVVTTIEKFKEAGWFTFTFVRHPGELLCSFYHYVYDYYKKGAQKIVDAHCPVVDRSLDEFVSEHCEKELLPTYWEIFDAIAEVGNVNFEGFFRQHLNHTFQPGIAPSHASGSKGYQHYCRNGTLSRETQQRVEGGISMRIYRNIVQSSASTQSL